MNTKSRKIIASPSNRKGNDDRSKDFPFNIKTWNGSLSDCASTQLDSENYSCEDEEENMTRTNQESHLTDWTTKNPGLRLEDFENRYKLVQAWSSLTDIDHYNKGDQRIWEKVTSSKIAIDDRISQRFRNQKMATEDEEHSPNKNNNSFIMKQNNQQEEATAGSESGFPTYLTEGLDSESLVTITSSMSIPIPGFGEGAAVKLDNVKGSPSSERGFMKLLSMCCFTLRNDSDSCIWSYQDEHLKSCEGDHVAKTKEFNA